MTGCPDQVRLASGTRFHLHGQDRGRHRPYAVTLGDAVQKVAAVVRDLEGTVMVRS